MRTNLLKNKVLSSISKFRQFRQFCNSLPLHLIIISDMRKKIYFAGSIRGGRADATLYRRIIHYMSEHHTVLTEHVGSTKLCLEEQGRDGDARIYNQDTAWLRDCDLLVAECSCPSLGVGYELAYAEHLGKPVHIFYNSTKCQLSAMLTGNSYFKIYSYEKEEEIFDTLNKILGE